MQFNSNRFVKGLENPEKGRPLWGVPYRVFSDLTVSIILLSGRTTCSPQYMLNVLDRRHCHMALLSGLCHHHCEKPSSTPLKTVIIEQLGPLSGSSFNDTRGPECTLTQRGWTRTCIAWERTGADRRIRAFLQAFMPHIITSVVCTWTWRNFYRPLVVLHTFSSVFIGISVGFRNGLRHHSTSG